MEHINNPINQMIKFRITFIKKMLISLFFLWTGLFLFENFNLLYFGIAIFNIISFGITQKIRNYEKTNKLFNYMIYFQITFAYINNLINPSYLNVFLILVFLSIRLTTITIDDNYKISLFRTCSMIFVPWIMNLPIELNYLLTFGILSIHFLGNILVTSYYNTVGLILKNQSLLEDKNNLEKAVLQTAELIIHSNSLNIENTFINLINTMEFSYIGLWLLNESNELKRQSYYPQQYSHDSWIINESLSKEIIKKNNCLMMPILSREQDLLGYLVIETNYNKYWLTGEDVNILNILTQSYSSFFGRKRAEEVAEGTAKMSALGEIAAGIAHEINNPLAIVHGKATMIQLQIDGVKDGETLDLEELELNNKDLLDSMERVDKIVNSLRYFVRDDSQSPFASTNVEEILDNVQVLSIDRCKKSGIVVKIEKDIPKDFKFDCKPTQISQVLINLVNNSFDAIQDQKQLKWINIHCKVSENEQNVIFEVVDSGNGIPREIGDKILQAFYTTKKLTKNSGSGLGLNIVRRIIESHRGTISIDYDFPNTKFIIQLPIKQS